MSLQLHPRAALYFTLERLPPWAILALWLVLLGGRGPQWRPLDRLIGVTVLALLAVLAAIGTFCVLKARAYRIELRPVGVALDYGVLNKSHETLLYARIQDILISRNIVERLMGLSTLVIQNAMGRAQRIPALGVATALELRDAVLERAGR